MEKDPKRVTNRHGLIHVFRDVNRKWFFSRGQKRPKLIGNIALNVIVRRASRWRLVLHKPGETERTIVDLKRNVMRPAKG